MKRTSIYKPEPRSGGHGRMNDTNHAFEEREITRPPLTNGSSPASKRSPALSVKASPPVPVKSSTPLPVKASTPLPIKASTQVRIKASQQEGNSTTPAHDNGWVGFQTTEAKSTPGRSGSSNFIESMTQPNLTSPSLEKPLKVANNDIMNLFNKSSMVSPFSVYQQLLAKMLSQQQQFITATAAMSK